MNVKPTGWRRNGMWISKRKWERLEKRIADLEKKVQSQQMHVEISKKALTRAGLDYDHLEKKASQKQS